MIDLEELKRLARAATPGPWKYNGEVFGDRGGKFDEIEAANGQIVSGEYGGPRDEEAEYIAAANPSVILELIERLELDNSERREFPMPADEAINLAELWRAGKMAGGDPFAVCDALLLEVNRLSERLERAAEWIPCESRLPSRPGMKTVFVPTLDEDKPFIGMAWFEPAGTGNMEGWQLLPDSFCDAITHWMELSPPSTNAASA